MAASGPEEPSSQIGKALVEFSLRGAFPEEDASSLALTREVLPPAIEALTQAKVKLQVRTSPDYRISVSS
jgi:centromere/kinetochore protein ZW10